MARMTTYIALFRGINVGGRHMLPMKEFKPVLERHDCQAMLVSEANDLRVIHDNRLASFDGKHFCAGGDERLDRA